MAAHDEGSKPFVRTACVDLTSDRVEGVRELISIRDTRMEPSRAHRKGLAPRGSSRPEEPADDRRGWCRQAGRATSTEHPIHPLLHDQFARVLVTVIVRRRPSPRISTPGEPAGAEGLPDLARAPFPDPGDQMKAGDRLRAGTEPQAGVVGFPPLVARHRGASSRGGARRALRHGPGIGQLVDEPGNQPPIFIGTKIVVNHA